MRIRTADILLAKQTLYQLSYTPLSGSCVLRREKIKLCAAILYYADFLVVFRCMSLQTMQPQIILT